MLDTLRKNHRGDRGDNVSIALGDRFNKLLEGIKSELPDYAATLPPAITSTGDAKFLGLSDVHHVDLEVYLEELISVLVLIENEA
jgi:hypothetical protein